MSGRCHIIVTPALLDRLREHPDIRVLDDDLFERAGTYETNSGALLHTCEKRLARISTTLLSDGENGHQNVIISDNGAIRFERDCDV